jgi:hypothetical protein
MAGESLFFARQLEYIRPQLYEKKFPARKARLHFPVNTEGGSGLQTITHRMITRAGLAAIGMGFPRSEIAIREFTSPVKPLTSSYSWDIQELREAMRNGTDLNAAKANAAKAAIIDLENLLAYVGDPQSGLIGAFNHPNIPRIPAPYPVSTNGSTSTSTPDQIIATYNLLINQAFILSRGVEEVTAVLSTPSAHAYISSVARGSVNDTTILEFLQKAHPNVDFDWASELTGAGTAGTDALFAYCRDEDHLTLNIPSPFEQLPEHQTRVAEWEVGCLESFGGIEYRYATAVMVDGI